MEALRRLFGRQDESTIVRTHKNPFVPGYPWRLVRSVRLRDGAELLLRPVRPDDEPRLVDLFHRSSSRTVYQRFFRTYERLPAAWYHHFANVDYRTRLALVAEEHSSSGPVIRALAQYEPGDVADTAEIRVFVEGAWEGRRFGG